MACLAIVLAGVFSAGAGAAETPEVEYLSDVLSDRAISVTQGWGYLGVDTTVGATVSVPKPVRASRRIGRSTRKVVPADQPAPKLRIKDKEYARGLGIMPTARSSSILSGQFKTFEAEVGVQWSDGKSPGSVVFQVFVDGKKVFDSGVMRENDPPRPVTVSVEGADELRLVVNDAGDGITADCADWADARLTRDPAAKEPRRRPSISPRSPGCSRGIRRSWKERRPSARRKFPPRTLPPTRKFFRPPTGPIAVPATDGIGRIGLQWDENRMLRRVAHASSRARPPCRRPSRSSCSTGPANRSGKESGSRRRSCPRRSETVWSGGSAFKELPQGTQKVRWVFSDVKQPIVLKQHFRVHAVAVEDGRCSHRTGPARCGEEGGNRDLQRRLSRICRRNRPTVARGTARNRSR